MHAGSSGSTDTNYIKLLKDYTDSTLATFNRSATFDLNGHKLTRTKTITVSSSKKLIVTGEGNFYYNNGTLFTNNGDLRFDDNFAGYTDVGINLVIDVKDSSANFGLRGGHFSGNNIIENNGGHGFIAMRYKFVCLW